MKITEKTRIMCLLLCAILTVSLAVPVNPEAAGTEKQEEAAGQNDSSGQAGSSEEKKEQEIRVLIANIEKKPEEAGRETTAVSGLKITGVDDPAAVPGAAEDTGAGKPDDNSDISELDGTAEVVSAEGITWEIPVFWVNADRRLVKKGTPGRDCTPVMAFFLPEEYRAEDGTEQGFMITLDAYLSSLFEKAGGAVCIYEPKTRITYILAAGLDLSFLETEEERKLPKPVPGLSEEEEGSSDAEGDGFTASEENAPEDKKPEESTSGDTSEESGRTETSEDPGDPVDNSKLLAHCAKNTIDQYGEDEMASLVDLIINRIQPQAVNLIRTKFPAFAAAAQEGGLGEEIGLYVYRNRSDADDDTYSHKNASPDVCAYTDSRVRLNREKDEYQLEYLIGVNTKFFETVDEDGNYHIDTSEEKLTDLDHTLVHEMLHVFMYDYNRTGATGMSDISVYVLNKYKYRRECEVNRFPGWFEEGLASSVEYNYNLRHDAFKLLRYEAAGVIGDRYTEENVLKAYTTKEFLLPNGESFADDYDLDDPYEEVTSCYATGYLANLYLGGLAAEYAGLGTSVTVDDIGKRMVSSETIRMGLNAILDRLHSGECLDDIICSISNGSYQDTEDFEAKFIKGDKGAGDAYSGDEDSISFVVDFLNYMMDIEEESGQIPNGSVLFDFDQDFCTPIDRSAATEEIIYQINDSDDYVFSTVWIEAPHTDAGKSTAAAQGTASNYDPGASAGSGTASGSQGNGSDLLAARVNESGTGTSEEISDAGAVTEPVEGDTEEELTEEMPAEAAAEADSEMVPEPVEAAGPAGESVEAEAAEQAEEPEGAQEPVAETEEKPDNTGIEQ